MRPIFVIAGREIRSLFVSPIFYVVSGLCSVVWSILYINLIYGVVRQSAFAMMRQQSEGPNIHFEVFAKHIGAVNFIMILACAALTMRLIAEEKKARTYDLLMTSPISPTQLVLGKFFGGLVPALALVGVSALYPLAMAPFVQIPWGLLISSYLGLMMIVAVYVALGMFASSLTENPTIAVVTSLVFSVGVWFIGVFAESAENPIAQAVLNHLVVGTHFMNFIKGLISVASFIFLFSVIFLGNFLTQRVVESSRWR